MAKGSTRTAANRGSVLSFNEKETNTPIGTQSSLYFFAEFV